MMLYVIIDNLMSKSCFFFFFNDTATTEIYTLSLHDALPISPKPGPCWTDRSAAGASRRRRRVPFQRFSDSGEHRDGATPYGHRLCARVLGRLQRGRSLGARGRERFLEVDGRSSSALIAGESHVAEPGVGMTLTSAQRFFPFLPT